jgi:hypothetical protein
MATYAMSVAAACMLSVVASSMLTSQPSDAAGKKPEPPGTAGSGSAHLQAVFWGNVQIEEGRASLADIHVISGEIPERLPMVGRPDEQRPLPPLGFCNIGLAAGSIELPLKYVVGRRYLVCAGKTRYTNWYEQEPGSDQYFQGSLSVIDLDETQLEAQTRAMYRQRSGRHLLPQLKREEIDSVSLDKWLAESERRVAAGEITVGDVVEALGEPNARKQTGEGEGVLDTEAVYLLVTKKLIERSESEDKDVVTIRFPALIVHAHGAKVTMLKKEDRKMEHRTGRHIML